jgi:hypothetical protein
MHPARALLIVLAAARLTRLITEDVLGEWVVRRPVRTRAITRETEALTARTLTPEAYNDIAPITAWGKADSLLGCRWCIGFWLGVAVLLGEALTARGPLRALRPAWTFALAALALNSASNAVGKWTGTLP